MNHHVLLAAQDGDGAEAHAYDALREYVEGHALRVSDFAVAVGRDMGLDAAELRSVALVALLHDGCAVGPQACGFIGGGEIFEGAGCDVRAHARLRERVELVPGEVSRAVRHVHEHWDGSGGPDGLSGVRIPLAARIVMAADAYDAMTGRADCDHEAAVRFLLRGAGSWFDPEVARVMAGLDGAGDGRGAAVSLSGGARPETRRLIEVMPPPSHPLDGTCGDGGRPLQSRP